MTTNWEIGKSITANGISTNYLEAGSGSPLVLIHGSGPGVTAFANWNGVMPRLAENFHVYAPDMVGFGYTDCRESIKDFNLDLWVDHIVGFLDALGIARAAFVGNSYGGALSLAIAARHPDRVERLVLMGSAGLEFEITEGLMKVWAYSPSLENMRKLMETFAHRTELVTDAIVKSRHAASIRPGAHNTYSRLFPEPLQDRLNGLATPEADVRAIPHDVLIIHGREDVIVPVDVSYRFSQLIPHSELHVFGGCGHWTQIEKKDRFVDLVLSFLDRASTTEGD